MSATTVTEHAAAWVATLSDENCGPEEQREFVIWLTRSTEHVEEFLRISALTRRLQVTPHWPEEDIERLLAEARSEMKVSRLPRMSSPGVATSDQRPMRMLRALAASLALVVIAFLIIKAPGWLREGEIYVTATGELRSITLSDGSIVQLNAQSTLRTRFTEAERRVELVTGEAIFQVARNPARPFKVSTTFADIVAVGTQFNVDAQTDETVVTVLEGTVKANGTTHAAPIVLTAGQQAVIHPKRAIAKFVEVDAVRTTGWTERRLYFEDTALTDAVREFARYSPQTIRINDPALSQRRITGTFDSSDPAALVQFLARYGDTTVIESEDGWILGRK